MARATDRVLAQLAFTEGSAIVGTNIINTVKFAGNFAQNHEPIVDFNHHLARVGQFVGTGNDYKITHQSSDPIR
jgi:hypothetical protein